MEGAGTEISNEVSVSGTEIGFKDSEEARASWAIHRRRYAFAPMDDVDPL